jgi:hypothetical protein
MRHSEALNRALSAADMARWREFHAHMDAFQEARYKKHAPTVAQMAKYTSYEDIETRLREMRKKRDPHAALEDSQTLVLLSIIASTPPKRSDYGAMRVMYKNGNNNNNNDDDNNYNNNYNYIMLMKNNNNTMNNNKNNNINSSSYMVFNRYKTAKMYGRLDQELTPETTRDILDSLRRHPRDFLFVNRFGKPFETNDAWGKYLRRIFVKQFGKATGTTMLRHIFITEKLSFDNMDDDELEFVAKQMMHSTALQRKYNWNKKAICKAAESLTKATCSSSSSSSSA